MSKDHPHSKKRTFLSQKNVQLLLDLEDLPPTVKKFIEEKLEFAKCDEETTKTIFKEVKEYISTPITKTVPEPNKFAAVLFAMLSLLRQYYETGNNSSSELAIKSMGWIYLSAGFNLGSNIRTLVTNLALKVIHNTTLKENFVLAKGVLEDLLITALKPQVNKVDSTRLYELKNYIKSVDIMSSDFDSIRPLMLATVLSRQLIKYKEGATFAGLILSRHISFIRPIHQQVLDTILNWNKKDSANIGLVYYFAWLNAEEDVKKEIEDYCIQDLMEKVFKLARNGLEMGKAGSYVFSILSTLHRLRQLKRFSATITRLYAPLIWRALRSGHDPERCNAAQVLFDVFPLEKVDADRLENIHFKERQLKEIKDLLVDPYHIVRILAIRGTCYHLAHSMKLLCLTDLKQLYSVIIDSLAFDSSTYLVRLAVFESLATMIPVPETREILPPILEKLGDHLYDENDKVRRAFVKLLQKIDDEEDYPVKYWNVTSIEDIVLYLVEDVESVGKELAKLIMPSFYVKGQITGRTMNKHMQMMKVNINAPIKLYSYSYELLDVEDVYSIIVTLVGTLNKLVKQYYVHKQEDAENEKPSESESVPPQKKRLKKRVLKDISNNDANDGDDDDQNNEEDKSPAHPKFESFELKLLTKHKEVGTLLCAAAVLWAKFSSELAQVERYINNLYILCSTAIPMLLRYYRNTPIYYNVIDFASLVPINKLSPVSTISSACISELKEVNENTPDSIIVVLVYALCSWKRGPEIIDLITDWLNSAFRLQDLNMTCEQARRSKRKRKVRFAPAAGKPLVALKIFEHMMYENILNFKRMMDKNYDNLFELFTFIERIKTTVERRFELGQPFEQIELSDKFLYTCYKQYTYLGVMLHRPDTAPQDLSFASERSAMSPQNAAQFCVNCIEWANRVLVPHLPSEADASGGIDLAVRFAKEIQEKSNLAISLNYMDKVHSVALCIFTSNILDLGCAVHFVEEAVITVKYLAEYGAYHTENDDWMLLNTMLPSLQSKILKILIVSNISQKNVSKVIKNVPEFKTGLFKILLMIRQKYKVTSPLFKDTYNLYIWAVIQLICCKMLQENELAQHSKFDDHSYLASLIMKFILSKPILADNLIPCVEEHLFKYKEIDANLLSCISLLYTLSSVWKPALQKSEPLKIAMESCLQKAYNYVKEFEPKKMEEKTLTEEDSFYASSFSVDLATDGLALLKDTANLIGYSFQIPT